MGDASKASLHRLAVDVRNELGLKDDQPFDPHAWAELWGIPFVALDEVGASTDATQRFLSDAPELWSAALIEDGAGHVVVFNPAHSLTRVRSNLAHEAAHFVAEHEMSPGWMDGKSGCGGTGRGQENDAAELSGALLIPVKSARQHAMRGVDPGWVAARYRVSLEMAVWRMRVSGGAIIAQRARKRRA